MKTSIFKTCAFLSSLFCVIGGISLVTHGISDDDLVFTGIGLYFIGKAFFVGPMLAGQAK